MAVLELGWSSLLQANAYFENERYETTLWDAITMTADLKNKALNMAYNRIYYHPNYSVPAAGEETLAQKDKLIIVQCEMAYYFLVHLADEDRRMGLEAQHVTDAGIVEEKYDKDKLAELPVPPIVDALLEAEGFVTEKAFGMVNLDRDEDESVDEKVDDF